MTEAHVYMRRHQDAKVKHFDVSNVIYHKSSHSAVYCTLNGENVNVMLEYLICIEQMHNIGITPVFGRSIIFLHFFVKPAYGELDIVVTTSVWCMCVHFVCIYPFRFVLAITSSKFHLCYQT